MATGIVKWFNSAKGFGFAELEGTGAEVFLHVAEWRGDRSQPPAVGDRLEFDTEELTNGLRARNIRKLGLTPESK